MYTHTHTQTRKLSFVEASSSLTQTDQTQILVLTFHELTATLGEMLDFCEYFIYYKAVTMPTKHCDGRLKGWNKVPNSAGCLSKKRK